MNNVRDCNNTPGWREFCDDEKLISIDPGTNGGICIYSVVKKKVISLVIMPQTPLDLWNYLSKWQQNSRCYLEKVGGLPGMGGSAMFNFGKGFGHIEMCLVALRIPTIEVTPQKWQKVLQLGNKGTKSTNEWKTKLKERSQQLWPSTESDFNIKTKGDWLAVSDALLIMEYARQNEKMI